MIRPVGRAFIGFSLEEVKKKIDKIENYIPLTLVTKTVIITANIVEIYKGFKIRQWTDSNNIVRYDTAYQ